ncbi:MAG TPA: alkaline phosphatase family protein [Anaerolineales bacterium]|nr:alkaline phosphatase family protein [Anaerolineales bacterium]
MIKPAYGQNCFSEIPNLVRGALGVQPAPALAQTALQGMPQQYDKVVLFFLDALGWRFVAERIEQYGFLRAAHTRGRITQLTSQFPSTTAVHMTTMQTGLEVGQHGHYEWFHYDPTCDEMICPLMFGLAGSGPETLRALNLRAEDVYPAEQFGAQLREAGVGITSFLEKSIVPSTYSQFATAGGNLIPYQTLAEGLSMLADCLQSDVGKQYYFFYYDGVDAVAHRFGPSAPAVSAEIDMLLTTLDRQLVQPLSGKANNTLILAFADHGQIDVDPTQTLYLDEDPAFAGLKDLIKRNQRGKLLVPAGSARDLFLHIQAGQIPAAEAILRAGLGELGQVHRTADLLAQGYFGQLPVSPRLLARLGDLVVLPRPGQMIYWHESGKFEQKFRGHHGGLTPEEMLIPLIALPL